MRTHSVYAHIPKVSRFSPKQGSDGFPLGNRPVEDSNRFPMGNHLRGVTCDAVSCYLSLRGVSLAPATVALLVFYTKTVAPACFCRPLLWLWRAPPVQLHHIMKLEAIPGRLL